MTRKKTKLTPPATGYDTVLAEVVRLVQDAWSVAARSVNSVMTAACWEIGRRLVEHEQGGAQRAAYTVDRLETARLFYLAYAAPSISATASRKSLADKSATPSRISPGLPVARFVLSWSHYVLLVRRARLPVAREFYEEEAIRGGWIVRQLERQIESQFYERTALSRSKAAMLTKGAGLPSKVLAAEYRTTLPKERLIAETLSRTRDELEARASRKGRRARQRK